MPSTWEMYGVDANDDGRKDPYNPVDAICAAARYLKAAGGDEDLRTRDLRLQPRRLVRRRGPPLREPVRQAARRPGRLAHRAHRGRPLPGRRRRPLRRRHLRAPARSSARSPASAPPATPPTSSQARPPVEGSTSTRREGAPVVAVNDGVITKIGKSKKLGKLHRPPGRLRQPLHLRRARRGLRGLPGAEGEQALTAKDFELVTPDRRRRARRAGQRRDPGRRSARRSKSADAEGGDRGRRPGQHRGLARPPLRLPGAHEQRSSAPVSPASSTRCSPRRCPATRPFKGYLSDVLQLRPEDDGAEAAAQGLAGHRRHRARPDRQDRPSSRRTSTSRSARPAAARRRSTRSRSSTAGSCSRRPRSTAPPARTRSPSSARPPARCC